MARTNLHELATRLLVALKDASVDGSFEGKLRTVSAEAGLNSVRSAEAVKLLEEVGRIEVVQRGRRGRDTIVSVVSDKPVTIAEAEKMLPSRASKRAAKLDYDDLGRAAVDKLLELSRDDSLRAAQVEAFATERDRHRARLGQLEAELEEARERETDLRIKLRAAEDALRRAEDNLQKVFGNSGRSQETASPVDDDDARAVLDILRSGRS